MNDLQATTIIEALNYAKQFAHTRVLIKLGGSVLDDPQLLTQICADIRVLQSTGIHVSIVHGGGKAINQALAQQRLPTQFIDGLRVTSAEAMAIIEPVLCRQVNHAIVKQLEQCGAQAFSVFCKQQQLLLCERHSVQHGLVGKVVQVNRAKLAALIPSIDLPVAPIPVIAPIGVDATGTALNVNADCAASAIASALNIDKFVFMTDQDGIYDSQGDIISLIDKQRLQTLIADGTLTDGMLIKAQMLLNSLNQGLNDIHVINGKKPQTLLIELFTDKGIGTLVQQTSQTPHADVIAA